MQLGKKRKMFPVLLVITSNRLIVAHVIRCMNNESYWAMMLLSKDAGPKAFSLRHKII